MKCSIDSPPEISVVVAFYNVEKYVSHCLDSLLAQDYLDYEVVCVDDGSTDATALILDEYARRDRKIIVVHKQNGGLSDARNVGVRASHGRLIAFVDGDDIVSPKYLSSMRGAMGDTNDCMVIARVKTTSFEDVTKDNLKWCGTREARMCTRAEVLNLLLYDIIQPCAYAKLAPRSVYEKTPFPLGVKYEEIRTIVQFIRSVTSYVLLDEEVYGYVMRSGSITWPVSVSAEQLCQYRFAIETICSESSKEPGICDNAIAYQKALLDTRAHSQLPVGARRDIEVRKIDDDMIMDLRTSLYVVLRDRNARLVFKLRFLLLSFARPIYDAMYQVFKTKIKKVA